MIQISSENWEHKNRAKVYLSSIYRSLTEFFDGKDFKIVVSKGTNPRIAAASLREIAEFLDSAETVLSHSEDDDDDDDDESDPFARPSDDDYDPADFWKKPKKK